MTKASKKKKSVTSELKDELKIALLKAKVAPWWQKAAAGVVTLIVGTLVVRKVRG